MSGNGDRPTLRITDMTDRELVEIIADMVPPGDWVSAREIAQEIWPRRADDHTRLSVLRRLSFMRSRAGLVEKHDKQPDQWRLSPRGEVFRTAKLKAAQVRMLDTADSDQLVEVMNVLGSFYHDLADESAWLLRREWQHHLGRR
jgi:hypothetical protein